MMTGNSCRIQHRKVLCLSEDFGVSGGSCTGGFLRMDMAGQL